MQRFVMRKFIFLPLAFLLIGFNGRAQEKTLTFEEAVKIALEQNVDLKTQENELTVIKAEKVQSIAGIAPNVSLRAQAWQSSGNTFLQQEAKTINTVSDNLYAGFGANMNLFSGFQRINSIKKANADLEAQRHLLHRTSQEVIYEVATNFLQVLLDVELLKIANDNFKTQQVLLEQISAMVEAGNKAKSDRYDQQATVKRMELLAIRARNDLSNDEGKLAICLQLDPTIELDVVKPDWDLDVIRSEDYSIEELNKLALANRSDLKEYQFLERSAEDTKAISKGNFMPSVGLYYNYSSRFNNQSDRTFSDQFVNDNKYNEVGLSLDIPIFSGLSNRTTYVRSKMQLADAKLNTENLRKKILTDVKTAYQNFNDVSTAYDVSIAQVEAAQQALDVQKEKYRLGIGNLIELTNANNNYVQAAASKAQAEISLLFQKVILDYHTGILKMPLEDSK